MAAKSCMPLLALVLVVSTLHSVFCSVKQYNKVEIDARWTSDFTRVLNVAFKLNNTEQVKIRCSCTRDEDQTCPKSFSQLSGEEDESPWGENQCECRSVSRWSWSSFSTIVQCTAHFIGDLPGHILNSQGQILRRLGLVHLRARRAEVVANAPYTGLTHEFSNEQGTVLQNLHCNCKEVSAPTANDPAAIRCRRWSTFFVARLLYMPCTCRVEGGRCVSSQALSITNIPM